MTSPLVAEMLVLSLAGILTLAALGFSKRLTSRIGYLLLALALIAALVVSLRHSGLWGS